MKVNVQKVKKEFKPITLTLTIESDKELCCLWHRFNMSNNEVNEVIQDDLKYKSTGNSDMTVWSMIDDLVIENNLKK